MKERLVSRRVWLFLGALVGIGLWVGQAANARVIEAATCAQKDVQAAVDIASTGDIVAVPSGSFVWSVSVSIPNSKKIWLQGSGRDKTIISPSIADSEILNLNRSGSVVSGFRFNDGHLVVDGEGWRVTRCYFYSATSFIDGILVRGTNPSGEHPGGLVDKCSFLNARVDIQGSAYSLTEGDQQHLLWAQQVTLGADPKAVYIEDCTFNFTEFGNCIDSNTGARYVFRYNTVTDTYCEAHSVQGNNRASRSWEIYNNTFIQLKRDMYMPFRLRGGTGVVFGNVITGTWSDPNIGLDNVRSCGTYPVSGRADGSSPWDGNEPGKAGYPARDQIGRSADQWQWTAANPYPPQTSEPAYCWENYRGTTPVVFKSIGCTESVAHIQLNRDFFNGIQKPGYAPYTYPHPLAVDLMPQPESPTGLRLK